MLEQFAQTYRSQNMPMVHSDDDSFGWVFLVGFIVITLIIGAALFITYKLAMNQPSAIQGNRSTDPLDIAKERLAKSEITSQEYADIKKALAEK